MWPMTGKGGEMDLAATEGGTLASVPTRLLHGLGRRRKAFSQCGILAAQVPYFGPSGCCHVHCEGTARLTEALSPTSQWFPLRLPPVEEQDQQMRLFGELQKTCEENAMMRRMKNDWILEESWRLLAHRATLRHTGHLCQTGGHRLNRQVGISLQKDRTNRTATVGAAVEAELTGGECP
jgi:hypothetical protein